MPAPEKTEHRRAAPAGSKISAKNALAVATNSIFARQVGAGQMRLEYTKAKDGADDSGALARYDAMCRAIDACYEVDEVKDIRDKALAIEAYARQAKNTEAERRACEIRLRAERKAGQLLATMEKGKGGGDRKSDHSARPEPSDYATAKATGGISHTQAKRWQQLAAVPEEQFEAALAGPDRPSTTGIIRAKPKPMDPQALWLWGRLRDFERDGILARLPDELLAEMTEAMQADVHRLVGSVADWLDGVRVTIEATEPESPQLRAMKVLWLRLNDADRDRFRQWLAETYPTKVRQWLDEAG